MTTPSTDTWPTRSISPRDLYEKWRSGEPVEIVDVRFVSSYAEAHVPGARSVPLQTLDPDGFLEERRLAASEPLYLICQIGVRSLDACRRFADAGFDNVVNVDGGTRAWQAAGLPVVHREQRMPLRRQVQLAAGALALAGSVAGLLLHPALIALAALTGAGLIYTGATDNCAMGILLGRMPWNQRPIDIFEGGEEARTGQARPSLP